MRKTQIVVLMSVIGSANDLYWARQVEIQKIDVTAWSALARGAKSNALREMETAAELEDGTEKSAIPPGPLFPALRCPANLRFWLVAAHKRLIHIN